MLKSRPMQLAKNFSLAALKEDLGSRVLYVITLLDVLFLLKDYHWFFSDEGAWPLQFAVRHNHWADVLGPLGTWPWEVMPLIFLAAIGALIYGLFFRASATTSLIASVAIIWIQRRNLALLDAGDNFVIVFLLWHALMKLVPKNQSALIQYLFALQLFLIYFENSMLKNGPTWTEWGTALNILWGQSYLSYDWIKNLVEDIDLKWLTFFARFAEMLIPFALLFKRYRPAAYFFFCYHLVIALTLRIELFPWINLAAWFLLITPAPATGQRKWPVVVAILWLISSGIQGINILFIKAPMSSSVLKFLDVTHLIQQWGMFSPSPRFTSYQYQINCIPGPCSEETKDWMNTPQWGRRRKQFMIRTAEQKYGPGLNWAFHQYMCQLNPHSQEVQISVMATIKDLQFPKKETLQEIKWPTPFQCQTNVSEPSK